MAEKENNVPKTQKEKIALILDQFLQEELGNRLSQFALLSLKSMILAELDKDD